MRFLIRAWLMVLAVWATFAIVTGLSFNGDWVVLVVVALIVGIANAVVITLLKLISLPVRILGLFALASPHGVLVNYFDARKGLTCH